MRVVKYLGFVLLTAAVSSRLSAQRGPHFELALVRVTAPAADTAHTDPAFSFDVAGVFDSWPKASVAIGVQRTSHQSSESPHNFNLLQLYVELRYYLVPSGKWLPYVSGRASYARANQVLNLIDDQGVNVPGTAIQSGPSLGVGAGVVYKVLPRLHVFLAGGAGYLSLGRIDFDGAPITDSQLKGVTTHVRFGASFDFSAPEALKLRRR